MRLTKLKPNLVLLGGLGVFYATFVFGEIDMRMAGSPLLELIFDGAIRDALLIGLWVLAVAVFWRHRHSTWRLFLEWLTTLGAPFLRDRLSHESGQNPPVWMERTGPR